MRVTDVQMDIHHHVMVKIVYDLLGVNLFGIKLIYYVLLISPLNYVSSFRKRNSNEDEKHLCEATLTYCKHTSEL